MTAYFSEHRTAHTACLMRIHYVKLIFIYEVLIAFSILACGECNLSQHINIGINRLENPAEDKQMLADMKLPLLFTNIHLI